MIKIKYISVLTILLFSLQALAGGGGGGGGGCSGGTSMSCGVSYSDNTSSGGCVGCDPTNNNNSIGLCCYAGADYDCNGTEDVTFSVENTQMFTYTIPAGAACPSSFTFTVNTTGNLQGAAFNTSDLGVGGGYDGGASTSDEYGSSVMGSGAFTLTVEGCPGDVIQIMVDGYAGAGAAFTISVPCPPLLSVQLVEFTGRANNDGSNTLTWKTMSEIKNDYFLVERSVTGKDDDFKLVGTVNGAGTTSIPQEYLFNDNHSPPDVAYYRIIAVDYDGTKQSNDSIVVRKNPLTNVIVSPNPVTDLFWLEGNSDFDTEFTFSIIDQVGRIIFAETHYIKRGSMRIPFNLQHMPQGVYYLDAYNQSEHQLFKIVKQ